MWWRQLWFPRGVVEVLALDLGEKHKRTELARARTHLSLPGWHLLPEDAALLGLWVQHCGDLEVVELSRNPQLCPDHRPRC